MIALTEVKHSSNIRSCAYDPVTHILAVSFKPSGAVWHYREVPPSVGEFMMQVVQQANAAFDAGMALDDQTPSVGRFFSAMVKPKYDGVKIVAE